MRRILERLRGAAAAAVFAAGLSVAASDSKAAEALAVAAPAEAAPLVASAPLPDPRPATIVASAPLPSLRPASFAPPARPVALRIAPIESEPIPAADRARGAVVARVPLQVSLWVRRADQRQFMVHRTDRQPMFDLDWSRERAELAVAQVYGEDCRGGSHLALQSSVWDPVGVYVIDAVCR